jgi:hypothetical protein
MKTALFILGMHRSGTSALARVVNLLGADLGSNLMEAASDNQKGFFEDEKVVAIHEALFCELGLSWKDSIPLPDGWKDSEAAAGAKAKIGELLDTEFADLLLWAMKDPRQCRFMPLWLPLLKERGITPKIILTYREPEEVAASLKARGDMNREAALHCWMSYTLEAYLDTVSCPQTIVSYDALMKDWRKVARQIAKELECEWPSSLEEAAEEIDGFLSPDLRHHQGKKEDYPKIVAALLRLLKKPTESKLRDIYNGLIEASEPYAELLRESRLEGYKTQLVLEEMAKKAAQAEAAVEDQKAQFSELESKYQESWKQIHALEEKAVELEAVYASSSWKVTKPLRSLRKKIAKSDKSG